MRDTMTYEATPVDNLGWMSEAHRLSLGANRLLVAASDANHLPQIALATCGYGEIARVPLLQPIARWLSPLKLGRGVRHSTM
jgi:hypothetical protein